MEGGMSLSALLKDPKALDERLTEFASSKEEVEGGLAAVSYANGLITAVIAGPEHVPATEWIPRIVNLSDETFSDDDARLAIATMLFEHSKIVKSLRSRSNDYEPFFWEDGEEQLITRDWTEGFLAGVSLRHDAWQPLRKGEAQMLFGMFSVLLQDEKIDAKVIEMGLDPEELFEGAHAALPGLIQALYSIREEQPADLAPFQRFETKTGRNDPCPCGSGKKYKKCCLN
jgi:uncharacterized protein